MGVGVFEDCIYRIPGSKRKREGQRRSREGRLNGTRDAVSSQEREQSMWDFLFDLGKWRFKLVLAREENTFKTEIGQPSVTQWQLNKWWRKARQKSSSCEQDPSGNIPGCPPSPYTQRAPSPARSWDTNQENSPYQSPILIPDLNYKLTDSPLVPSPGYLSPGSNTSPIPSPSQSPVPSPVLSVCPSPCGSPSACLLSPLPREPPRSPSPFLLSTHREQHPVIHSHLQSATQVFKSSQKKPVSKEPYNEHVDIEGRQQKRNQHKVDGNQQSRREKRESKRLAEEQLRRPWNQSSEEDCVEEAPRERRRTREEREHRNKDQHQKHGWHTKVNPKPPISHHHLQEKKNKTKKGRTTNSPNGFSTPPSPSSSSSWSSSADTEYQASIAKVPADSTSQKVARGRARDPSHPEANRSKSAPVQIGVPSEKQQSECRQKLYTLVPFGRGEKGAAFSQRGLGNLVVQIDLCLLKRVPDNTSLSTAKSLSHVSSATKDKQREAMKHLHVNDGKRKRKMENGVSHKESKKGIPSANKAGDNHLFTETSHTGPIVEYLESKRPVTPVSPIADSPEYIKPVSQIKTSEKNRVKNREATVKPKMEVESHKCSKSTKPPNECWGPSGHRGAVTLPEIQHHAEYYLHEAKRMKHRADAMVDKLGKAVNYVDAALSFMECGKAMEQGPLEAKSPYTMYAETVELIRYAMRLKSHSGPGARQEDKQLAVLCFRCLALLYWQMFRLKKDHALKYSKVLLEYFKTSPKVPASASCWNGSAKSPGEHPSSFSPDAKKHNRSLLGGNSSSSFINIPHRIHQMAANHLNITNSVLYSYEYWEVADNLAKENIEFFNYLNTLSGPLTLHSSIAHAVQYTRQALQWIRISAKLN
ncbi:hypothetical protein WMY93_028593 [Mugilogobius chulae]|uniref:AF4/FMR2 C-terminal homology domain-containing protein n=1 Tax=Mugilogobius chulae TaxID=88201 RepID=A0AAW0MSX2_9GOBI